jgi:hypothetical protein
MGRHSAPGGREGRSDDIPGIPGVPPPAPADPGSGRRRRIAGWRQAPQQAPGPAPAREQARGPRPEWAYAHPEHREHAAWGDAESWDTGSGPAVRGLRAPELPDPEVAELLGSPEAAGLAFGAPPAPRLPRQRRAAVRVPGPRKEFVDAFETQHTAPQHTAPDSEEPPKGGGKGRTFGGAAAAAVVTVLAVVVAGQLAGGAKDSSATGSSSKASRGADGSASRSDVRSTPSTSPSASASAVTLTYHQAMVQTYPLNPGLALSGKFRTVGGHQKAPGKGQVYKVRVDVEQGLSLDGEVFADAVYKTLNDDRSWGHGDTKTFERVSTGHADIVVTLASPGTTAKWCAKSGLDTSIENVSCDSASTSRTMINAYRWAQGSETYGPDKIYMYRQMVINHEVGHRLGHRHELCPKNGALAPVMMQQTKFLTLDGVTCRPNPWPYPKG